MYKLALQRQFIAQHYLIGGDWGPENHLHSHPFRLEVQLSGDELDQHGYLLDLVELLNDRHAVDHRLARSHVVLHEAAQGSRSNPSWRQRSVGLRERPAWGSWYFSRLKQPAGESLKAVADESLS